MEAKATEDGWKSNEEQDAGERDSKAKSLGGGKPSGTAESIRKAIEAFEKKIAVSADEIKMADYVRLLQLQKDLGDEAPAAVVVGWVDAWIEESSNEK